MTGFEARMTTPVQATQQENETAPSEKGATQAPKGYSTRKAKPKQPRKPPLQLMGVAYALSKTKYGLRRAKENSPE